MRRAAIALAALAAVLSAAAPATAHAPSPTAPQSPAAAGTGEPVCTISDPRVTEVSGMVATEDGFVVVNDSNIDRDQVKIFTLTGACKVTRAVSYPRNALDPEDVAVDAQGTVWVADIGDNSRLSGGSGTRRSTIALWSLPAGQSQPTIHRLVYPDGVPRDAEALLLAGDGRPVIVTKEPMGEVYVPDGPLRDNNTEGVPLRKVGAFVPERTRTPNPLGFLGEQLITGGAVSPDGTRAVIRTMSDAYEFDVTGGDVAKAVTTGKPRVTALPNEPQGEAICYSSDGRAFFTASDESGATTVRRYAPKAVAPSPTRSPAAPAPAADDRPIAQRLTLRDLTWLAAGVGVFGVLIAAAGVVGIRRSRAARRNAAG